MYRKLQPLSNNVRKMIYDKNITVSVVADDENAAGSASRSIATAPDLYTPTTGMTDFAESGKKSVKSVCEDIPLSPPDVSLVCEDEMVADIILVVDSVSINRNDSNTVFDTALQIIRSIDKEDNEDIKVALVLHTDGEEPKYFTSTEDVRLEDVIWKAKHEGKPSNETSSLADISPTLDYLQREPILPRSYVPASKVMVVLTDRELDASTSSPLKTNLNELENENITSILAGPNVLDVIESNVQSPYINGLKIDKSYGPKKVISKANTILNLACKAPKRPLIEDVCEAEVEVAFIIDGELSSGYSQKQEVKEFMKKISAKMSFKTPRTVFSTTDFSFEKTKYKFSELDSYEENFPGMKALENVAELFNQSTKNARRVAVILSKTPSDAENIQQIRQSLIDLRVKVISVTIGIDHFMPTFEDQLDYKEIHVTSNEELPAFAAGVVSLACEPTPVIDEPEKQDNIVCAAGQMIFLYDVSLFSPMRDGRKVNRFLKRLMKLVGYGSTHTRATHFEGVVYGRDTKNEFSADTNDLIEVTKIYEEIDEMTHNVVPYNLPYAGKALDHAVSQSLPEVTGQETNFVILLIGRDSYDNLTEAVARAKQAGVSVITFYIGGLKFKNPDALSTIDYGSIKVERLYDLQDLEYEVLELICSAQPTTTAPPTTTVPLPEPSMPCKVDLFILVDDFFMQNPRSRRAIKAFLMEFGKSLLISPEQTNIALAVMGKRTKVINQKMMKNKKAYKKIVNRAVVSRTVTGPLKFTSSLTSALRHLNTYGRDDSNDVNRLVLIITKRRPKKNLLSPRKLEQYKIANINVASVVSDDASFLPEDKLTNIDQVINAKR